jgi:hypothetical protein
MDYDQLTATDELNKQIAEKLGYTVYRHVYDNDVKSVRWVLIDPNGIPYLPNDGREQMIINGVQHTVEALRSENAAWRAVPDFAGSVDAALALVSREAIPNGVIGLSRVATRESWRMAIYVDGRSYHGDAASAALAICRAWLVWQENKGE